MKRFFFAGAALLPLAGMAGPNEPAVDDDSLGIIRLQQIEVTATRATPRIPVAQTLLSGETIGRNNYGADIPFLLAFTPSVVALSETGTGVGATSIRMRGSDAARINITANGVPLNNPDSHAMYWYDTPDFLSAVGSVQVQRGAGTSTNGTGAFGGSVNMTTAPLSTAFNGDASLSYGSYNTNKQAVHLGSGLMRGHWVVDGRLTHIGSAGYVDRGATDLKSFLVQGGYYSGRTMLKLLSFGGQAKTYLTYEGATREEMALYGRRYHTSGQYSTSDGPYVLADGQHVDYYDDQTDNYLQVNNQLLFSHRFDDRWDMNLTLFYTYGYGYYKQYKEDAKLYKYGFGPSLSLDTEGSNVARDLIRRKVMRNHLGGANVAAAYHRGGIDLRFGGSWSLYRCPHWGDLKWIDGVREQDYAGVKWYDNDVRKQDANLFARLDWEWVRGLRFYADLQYRMVRYEAWGVNDNWDDARTMPDGTTGGMQAIAVDKHYDFFNPRVGLRFHRGGHELYFSVAVARKEPTRNDFTDRFRESFPRAEHMVDYEAGYGFASDVVTAGFNLYYMKYRHQLVKTGQLNDNGDALNTNVPESYRCGVELTASIRPTRWLTLGANATLSRNRIRHYVNRVIDEDWTYVETPMGTTPISYAPEAMGGLLVDVATRGFDARWHTLFVGEQYFTNYRNPAMRLDAYTVTNLNLGYTLHPRGTGSLRLGLAIYNLFNARYCSNGYGYSEFRGGEQHDTAYYFPQAPLNVLANVTFSF